MHRTKLPNNDIVGIVIGDLDYNISVAVFKVWLSLPSPSMSKLLTVFRDGSTLPQDTLLKDRYRWLVSSQPIRILFICCVYLFYFDNEIITVHGRPAICTLIGWFKSSRLFISLSGFCDPAYKRDPSIFKHLKASGLTQSTCLLYSLLSHKPSFLIPKLELCL